MPKILSIDPKEAYSHNWNDLVLLLLDLIAQNTSSNVTSSVNVAQWGGANTSLGQKVSSNSVPVVLASDQSQIPVSQSGTWNIGNISGTISLPTGAATEAKQDVGNLALSQINSKISNTINNGILVSSLPLTNLGLSSIEFLDLVGSATLAVNEYIAARIYTIPIGYAFELISFSAFAGNANNIARLAEVINFGSYNTSTNVYTDSGFSAVAMRFYAVLEAEVTTAFSATATTLTITYVNQDGVGGRIATATIPASAVVGRRIRAALQAGDVGVIDVTNVTDSANPTGVVRIQGVNVLANHRMTTAEFLFRTEIGNSSIIIPAQNGVTIQMEYATRTGVVATPRGLTAIFRLLPVNN